MTEGAPLLELRGVSKVFGAVRALSGVDLTVPAGKVTALAGDNGAGKSVLIKTISGLWEPTRGRSSGRAAVHFHSPKDAEAHGITTIYQDLVLATTSTSSRTCSSATSRAPGPARRDHDGAGGPPDPDRPPRDDRPLGPPAGRLASGGQRQSVAVAKAVMQAAKLVIMDEPTAALGVAQTQMVLELIKRLSSQGTAVILISHNLNDVFEVADHCDPLPGSDGGRRARGGVRPPGHRRLHDHRPIHAERGQG